MNIKCSLGFHDHIWKKISECKSHMVCVRCGKPKEDNKVELDHKWGAWEYIKERNCDQHRVCNVCGVKEFRTHHSLETILNPIECPNCGGHGITSPDGSQFCPTCGGYPISEEIEKCTRCDYERLVM